MVNCSEYALFVIYLLMSYSPFGNSFQWELVFYRKQSIHSFFTWFDSFLSDLGLTELNLRTYLRAIFVLCIPFYIISKPYVFLLLMFRVIKRVSIYLFSMSVSLIQWRREIGTFYNNALTFSKISIFCLLLSLSYGSIFCRLDLTKLPFLIISLILNKTMFFHFKNVETITWK